MRVIMHLSGPWSAVTNFRKYFSILYILKYLSSVNNFIKRLILIFHLWSCREK